MRSGAVSEVHSPLPSTSILEPQRRRLCLQLHVKELDLNPSIPHPQPQEVVIYHSDILANPTRLHIRLHLSLEHLCAWSGPTEGEWDCG
jgi:hypothetical protein